MSELIWERRSFLTSSVSVASTLLLLPFSRASAQELDFLRAEISLSRGIAAGLRAGIVQAQFPISDDLSVFFSNADYRGRLRITDAAGEVDEEVLAGLMDEKWRDSETAFRESGVNLIPRKIEEIKTDAESIDDKCQSKIDVCWDIVLDSLGLLDQKEFIKEAIYQISGGRESINNLNDAINSGDTDKVVDGIFNFGEFILDNGTIYALIELANARLRNRILQAISRRLLPFVGTGYAIVALGLAVRRHWGRLVCT